MTRPPARPQFSLRHTRRDVPREPVRANDPCALITLWGGSSFLQNAKSFFSRLVAQGGQEGARCSHN